LVTAELVLGLMTKPFWCAQLPLHSATMEAAVAETIPSEMSDALEGLRVGVAMLNTRGAVGALGVLLGRLDRVVILFLVS